MKIKGKVLILSGILGIIALLIYKTIDNTMPYFGLKSVIVLLIFGTLIVRGILLLKNKKK